MRTTLRGQFSGAFIHQLERLFHQGTAIGLTEGELLERFVGGQDESAFEALIARHGPMVLGVCRQLLRDPDDVDDAFQATFLVLVRKAGTLRRRDLLGNWLYGVAHRVATRSRCLSARRLARVPHGQDTIDRLDAADSGAVAAPGVTPEVDAEPSPWLHEEVRRLPEKYRVAVLLCYFEGLTHQQAASRLGCPLGTVKGRLTRALDLLRRRLTRRGITLSAAALAGQLALTDTRAAVTEALKSATMKAARAVAATSGASSIVNATSVSSPVANLADGVLQAMIMTNLKAAVVTLLVIGTVTTGAVISVAQPPAPRTRNTAKVQGPDPSSPVKKVESPGAQVAGGGSGRGPSGAEMAQMMRGRMQGPYGAAEGGGAPVGAAAEFQNRLTIAKLATCLAASEQNPSNQAIIQGLNEPLSMSFAKPTPLDEVLKYIKSSAAKAGMSPLPIYVDPKGLKDANVTPESKVVIDLEGAPLKTSLRLILKQLGLAYCVRDGVIIISSLEGIREGLAEAASEVLGNDPAQLGEIMQTLPLRGMGGGGGMAGGGMGMMSRGIR